MMQNFFAFRSILDISNLFSKFCAVLICIMDINVCSWHYYYFTVLQILNSFIRNMTLSNGTAPHTHAVTWNYSSWVILSSRTVFIMLLMATLQPRPFKSQRANVLPCFFHVSVSNQQLWRAPTSAGRSWWSHGPRGTVGTTNDFRTVDIK